MLNLKDYYSQCCQDVRGLIVKPFALIMNMWLKIYQFFYLSDLFRQILNTNLLLSSSLSLNKMSRKYWTLQEDQALKNIVQPMVDINWSLVVHRMYNVLPGSTRNAKQCRERWLNNLNRKSSDSYPWVSCEDKIILQQFLKYHQKEKNKWIIISQKVNQKPQNSKISSQRTPNDIKNRFYSIIRKGIRRINNELGKPVNPQEVRLLKPITISKLFQVIEQVQANEFLQIIYNMASDFPELSCYSQQISKEKLQRILAYVMEINRNQQKKRNRQNKTQKIKKRKSSLSTSQGQKRQNLNQSGLIFHQNQPIEQISNSQKIKESESYEKDIVDLFIGFYQQSQSLEFEQVDFGL